MKALLLFLFMFLSSFLFGQQGVYQHPTEKGCYQFQVGRTLYDFCNDKFEIKNVIRYYTDNNLIWVIECTNMDVIFYFTEVKFVYK